MPPSLPITITDWARLPLDRLLAANTGECLPEGAVQAAHELHKQAVATVPAYRAFCSSAHRRGRGAAGSQPDCTAADAEQPSAPCYSWQDVPFTSKQSYFHRWPLPQRCTGGTIGAADFVHCSSGSSGQPTLWARNAFDELAVCARFEQLCWDNLEAHRQPTLAVVAFPLGSWVGGLFTTLCLRFLTLKGYRLTTVTPGNKVGDILSLVQALAPHHSQTLLLGYPPFLKGVADAGMAAGVPWGEYRMRLCLAGEVFSEEWRTLMAQRLGMKDILRDVVSLYGTADAGVIGNETPLSVAIRRWLAQRPEAARQLFGAERLPTLLQYDPYCRMLERHPEDGTLVVTATGTPNTAAPLLRYCIGDTGGLISYEDMLAFVKERGFVLPADLQPRRLPFAFVFGRSFWTVSVFGANVFVENVMSGLEQPELTALTTGKFVLFVEESADLDKQLAVRVELAPGVAPSEELAGTIRRVLLRELLRLNSEYAAYVPADRQPPRVHLLAHGDPAWFPTGVKHRYCLG
ncbi:hypothetical protein CHLNCDRAFT_36451 [Chlorella variabilis]|uniref:AMP-dependent synthetase/ligase domain-containing protein n=1 Tax=Chlorella variabilis TaxID=554065 RepID=E1ZL38_CHLVA|nr:hypothetical protein CHLNCDRAFT_36451 [Chlorella variabilis]EFN53493.1 hypothetical protein CHLNCDRAFT_36451 [Chlorella variabilis]|eukprot:XP_005845595.1 hypothetical protein CHLNCDRAFT_36451 [Chlorella variabilis]